jgi:hypothetical protein
MVMTTGPLQYCTGQDHNRTMSTCRRSTFNDQRSTPPSPEPRCTVAATPDTLPNTSASTNGQLDKSRCRTYGRNLGPKRTTPRDSDANWNLNTVRSCSRSRISDFYSSHFLKFIQYIILCSTGKSDPTSHQTFLSLTQLNFRRSCRFLQFCSILIFRPTPYQGGGPCR